jgi:hypothetical protein
MPVEPIWVHWAIVSGLVRYLVGCWVADRALSGHQLPIGSHQLARTQQYTIFTILTIQMLGLQLIIKNII